MMSPEEYELLTGRPAPGVKPNLKTYTFEFDRSDHVLAAPYKIVVVCDPKDDRPYELVSKLIRGQGWHGNLSVSGSM